MLEGETVGRPLKRYFFAPHPSHQSGNSNVLHFQTAAALCTPLGEGVARAAACPLGEAHSQAQELSAALRRHAGQGKAANECVTLASKHLGTVILCSGWAVEPTKLPLQHFLPIMHISAMLLVCIYIFNLKGIKAQPSCKI